jgi:hypothetical protein
MVQNSIYLENEFYGLFEFFLRFFSNKNCPIMNQLVLTLNPYFRHLLIFQGSSIVFYTLSAVN